MIKYLWLILLPLVTIAQPKPSPKTNTDRLLDRADQLKSIAPDSALKILDALKSQVDSTSTPLQYGRLTVIYGFINDARDDYKTALKYYQLSLRGFQKAGDKHGIAMAYNNIGGAWYSMNDFDKAMPYYQKALAIRTVTGDKMLSSTYNDIGLIYYEQGNYIKAIKNYVDAVNVAHRFRDTDMLASLSSNICVVYWDEKDYARAMDYAQDALKYHTALGHYQGMATACNNIGGLYIDEKKYTEGSDYFKQAITYAEKVGHLTAIGTAYNNLAEVAFQQNNFKQALSYARQALTIRRKIGKNHGILRSLIKVAEASSKLKDYKTAKASLDEALQLAEADGNLREQKRINEKLSTYYKEQGQFEKALAYHEKFHILSDSLFNKDNIRTLDELQTKFETQKKQQQIKLLDQQNTIQKLTINRRNILIAVITALLLLLLILGSLFYNRYKLKQEARLQSELLKQQEAAAKGIIEAEERERKRIAGDLHDGVGQLFSTVRLNLGSLLEKAPPTGTEDQALAEKTLALVDESCREVRTMAHQMMPNILLKTGLANAIKDFVTKIDERKLKVNLQTSGLSERLDDNTEVVLYRIIQECVNNVIKHAAASRLDIQLHRDEDEVSVTIEDNGRGFDTAKISEGIGLKNIASRLAFLKGSVDFSSAPGKGTLVAIYVPLK